MILVDTSVWIDFLDGTENKQTEYLIESLESEIPVFYTGIILQEVLQGFLQQKQQVSIRAEFSKLLLINPTIEDHLKASEIFIHCRSKGYVIRKTIDCLIASIAIQYNLQLIDRDKYFEHISRCFPLERI
tara:strand:+ start:361 stop:750 length:390 start_codon:yes stop_codon:yes gene_type:complete